MNRLLYPILLAVITAGLLLVYAGQSSDKQPEEPAPVYAGKDVVKKEVILSVRVRRENVAGESIPLELTLTNHGKNVVRHAHVDFYHDWQFSVTDMGRKPVPCTRFGNSRLAPMESYKKYITKELAPGDSYQVTFNLALLFDLTTQGEYAVTIKKEMNPLLADTFELEVADVRFKIREPPLVATEKPVQTNK